MAVSSGWWSAWAHRTAAGRGGQVAGEFEHDLEHPELAASLAVVQVGL
jgi:hypothetical protein